MEMGRELSSTGPRCPPHRCEDSSPAPSRRPDATWDHEPVQCAERAKQSVGNQKQKRTLKTPRTQSPNNQPPAVRGSKFTPLPSTGKRIESARSATVKKAERANPQHSRIVEIHHLGCMLFTSGSIRACIQRRENPEKQGNSAADPEYCERWATDPEVRNIQILAQQS